MKYSNYVPNMFQTIPLNTPMFRAIHGDENGDAIRGVISEWKEKLNSTLG